MGGSHFISSQVGLDLRIRQMYHRCLRSSTLHLPPLGVGYSRLTIPSRPVRAYQHRTCCAVIYIVPLMRNLMKNDIFDLACHLLGMILVASNLDPRRIW